MNIRKNQGVIGTDVVVAIIILIVFVAIVTNIFYQIGITNIATTRHAMATNYVVEILEKIALADFNNINEDEIIEDISISKGYDAEIGQTDYIDEDNLIKELIVKVSYKIGDESKEVSIKTLKTRW